MSVLTESKSELYPFSLLCNLYSEEIISRVLDIEMTGIKVNGKPSNNIIIDETVINTDTLQERIMNKVAYYSKEYGLDDVHENQQDRYLFRNYKTENNDYAIEVKTGIEKAWNTFAKIKRVYCNTDQLLSTNMRLIRCYVFSEPGECK